MMCPVCHTPCEALEVCPDGSGDGACELCVDVVRRKRRGKGRSMAPARTLLELADRLLKAMRRATNSRYGFERWAHDRATEERLALAQVEKCRLALEERVARGKRGLRSWGLQKLKRPPPSAADRARGRGDFE